MSDPKRDVRTTTVSIIRPSNTTAYNAGDVIGIADPDTAANAGNAIHTFAGVGSPNDEIQIVESRLHYVANAIISGMTTYRLHLYSQPPTAILDNAVWDLPAADIDYYLGFIELGTIADVGATCYVQTAQTKRVKTHPTLANIYGQLVTVGGYTPASGERYIVSLITRASD
jgi:hypothetical protein